MELERSIENIISSWLEKPTSRRRITHLAFALGTAAISWRVINLLSAQSQSASVNLPPQMPNFEILPFETPYQKSNEHFQLHTTTLLMTEFSDFQQEGKRAEFLLFKGPDWVRWGIENGNLNKGVPLLPQPKFNQEGDYSYFTLKIDPQNLVNKSEGVIAVHIAAAIHYWDEFVRTEKGALQRGASRESYLSEVTDGVPYDYHIRARAWGRTLDIIKVSLEKQGLITSSTQEEWLDGFVDDFLGQIFSLRMSYHEDKKDEKWWSEEFAKVYKTFLTPPSIIL